MELWSALVPSEPELCTRPRVTYLLSMKSCLDRFFSRARRPDFILPLSSHLSGTCRLPSMIISWHPSGIAPLGHHWGLAMPVKSIILHDVRISCHLLDLTSSYRSTERSRTSAGIGGLEPLKPNGELTFLRLEPGCWKGETVTQLSWLLVVTLCTKPLMVEPSFQPSFFLKGRYNARGHYAGL